MSDRTRIAGLMRAASLPAAAAAIMLGLGSWNGELLATACLVALLLALVGEDGGASRPPRPSHPQWVPPWERSIHRPAPRRSPSRSRQ